MNTKIVLVISYGLILCWSCLGKKSLQLLRELPSKRGLVPGSTHRFPFCRMNTFRVYFSSMSRWAAGTGFRA